MALASLLLAVKTQGRIYAAIEARSMVAGAIAFFVYAYSVYWVSIRYKTTALVATLSHIAIWVVVAFGYLAGLVERMNLKVKVNFSVLKRNELV